MLAPFYNVWRSRTCAVVALVAVSAAPLRAAEHVTLKNGFALDCVRRDVVGDRVRLYLIDDGGGQRVSAGSGGYLEVGAGEISSVDEIAEPAHVPALSGGTGSGVADVVTRSSGLLEPSEMQGMLSSAGMSHNVDADLLASVVRAESGGRVRAVSRTGARGLMQLMPDTASGLGVKDSFAPAENIAGGTRYLDELLTRYHDDIALAVAAYNAGPAAVDRYHGVPPYRETRAYVARVIREFNRRKQVALRDSGPKLVSKTR